MSEAHSFWALCFPLDRMYRMALAKAWPEEEEEEEWRQGVGEGRLEPQPLPWRTWASRAGLPASRC